MHRSVIAVQSHIVGLVQVIIYRVGVVGEPCLQHFIGISLAHLVLNKSGYHLSLFVTPRVAHTTPVCIKIALHHLHLVVHSFFGILLHTRVERCIYLQAIRVHIEVGKILLHIILQCFAEIESLSIVSILYAKLQVDRLILQSFERLLISNIHIAKAFRQHGTMRIHVAEHRVTTFL